MKINKNDMIKFAGIAGTLMSIGATMLTSYSNKKEQEEIIDKKINEAMISQQLRLVDTEQG